MQELLHGTAAATCNSCYMPELFHQSINLQFDDMPDRYLKPYTPCDCDAMQGGGGYVTISCTCTYEYTV